jgi:hypothetical protein
LYKKNEVSYKEFYYHIADECLDTLDICTVKLIPNWNNMPKEIKIKTYLTLYSLESEITLNFTKKEKDIMRYACLCLHLGCCKKQSKTSKVYTQSFLSAREILAQLNHGFSLVLPEPMLSDS